MTGKDARFEDGTEAPLNLKALDTDDLTVISSLAQDAVFPVSEMTWQSGARRFAVLINRFRWEDRERAEKQHRKFERVQSLLVVEDVLKVAVQGVDRRDADLVLSLLSIGFEPGADGTGRLVLTLAGDGAVALDVECIDVTLRDVTRPYVAPSGRAPDHPDT
ncbi:DUF2948 domain-containing protein [Maritimibacter sp. 55A14]|uniref:DUF2948 family protein n=1 Tax=Maritimibacter sp. 55A14 TaxID=2174844 RepID=UPI000D605DFA|nr:DUF2948 family protein [Maritimibacter sp. 55A14]PWE32184.1 DUF2948 domain-containing protein [Maritimibacter sp. 55A14]